MSRRWQRKLRVFPLSSEFNAPYVRCAGGDLLSMDVAVVYDSPGRPRRTEPLAYWLARLNALVEHTLRELLSARVAEDVCRRRLATARAVVARLAEVFAADEVTVGSLDLLAPTRRPLGGACWARGAQRCTHTPGFAQAPSHQEVHSCRFT